MNKMDDYYKKNLKDYQPADDGWNIPSDELWDKAKPHFPKPKKKRRFAFILIPLGLTLLITTAYLSLRSPQKQLTQITTTTPSIEKKENITTTEAPKIEQTKESNDLSLNQTKETQISSNTKNKITPAISSKALVEAKKVNTKLKAYTDSTSKIESIDKEKDTAPTSVFTDQSNTRNSRNTLIRPQLNRQNKIAEASINPQHKQREPISLAPLNTLGFKQISFNGLSFNDGPLSYPLVKDILDKPKFRKHEIGIGSTKHLLSLLGKLENETSNEWPEEEIFFHSYDNKNLNLHYTYSLSKKWSISSGVYYNDMNFDLFGCTFDVLEASSINGFIETNLDNGLDNRITNSRQSNEFQIELLPGESVSAGDTLKIGLDVSLSFKNIQIPILLNRTWDYKRTQLFAGFGGSVDFQSWKQKSAEIALFRNNTLITKPYSEGEQPPDRLVKFSLIFQTGINYKISERLKFGLAARLFLPELVPTGFEARFLYSL